MQPGYPIDGGRRSTSMSEKSDCLAKFREPDALIRLAEDCEGLELRETEASADLLRWARESLGPEFFSRITEYGHLLFTTRADWGSCRYTSAAGRAGP